MRLGAVIAAGGVGSRMGTGESKQLMMLSGRPVLAWSTAIFQNAPEVEEIVIVIDPADTRRCRAEVVEPFGLGKVGSIVPGGENRAASVLNGLKQLSSDIDTVLIHDGARPLFPTGLLSSGLRDLAIGDCDGVVFGLPLTDTVKEVGIGTRLITRTPDRSRLWAAQTPQIFKRIKLEKAYRVRPSVLAEATDDSSLVERIGGWMKITPGSPENIKITTPEDIVVAEEILRRREIKGHIGK
ncbi:MAG: 2-C-methyl-D-erythritol 4-phosphate cytidylyltransferase [Actinobacteria bacterium]|nr:2-C-methyl-D-erythritol 4-phosphate cytidylyltransferase [Actinomycetota bacterium]